MKSSFGLFDLERGVSSAEALHLKVLSKCILRAYEGQVWATTKTAVSAGLHHELQPQHIPKKEGMTLVYPCEQRLLASWRGA